MKKLLAIIAKLFLRRKEEPVEPVEPKPLPVPAEPKPVPAEPKPLPVPAPVEPKPESDTKDDGNSVSPDWNYLWDTCKIDANRVTEVEKVCNTILNNKIKYLAVEAKTKVPWYLVAALHYREASLNFRTCLHNGDSLPGPTRHVPKGRGPFSSWEEASIDALTFDGLSKVNFDSVYTCLIHAEKYNGMGYRKKGEYTPYVWAGTNHSDETGKYTSDGKFSSSAREEQLGVAAIFKGLNIA